MEGLSLLQPYLKPSPTREARDHTCTPHKTRKKLFGPHLAATISLREEKVGC